MVPAVTGDMSDIPCQESGGDERAGLGGGTQSFFLVHKTDLWKSMSGWQSYYRYHPLYVSAEGSVLKTFITFQTYFYGLSKVDE